MWTPANDTGDPDVVAGAAPVRDEMTSERVDMHLHDDSVSLLALGNALLKARRLLVLLPLGVAAVVAAYTLIVPRTYTVVASFQPQSASGAAGRFAGFAQQLGLGNLGADPGQAPSVAAKLLKMPQLLGPVIDSPFVSKKAASSSKGFALADFLDVPNDGTPNERRDLTITALQEQIQVSVDPETQLVEFRVETEDPDVSAEISRRLLRGVNAYYLERKQDQAAAEKGFNEDRMQEILSRLSQAEEDQQAFLIRNRQYQGDPRLALEYDRLSRRVSLAQSVYTNMVYAYEQARLEAVRSTPTIAIVQEPETPVFPDRRHLIVKVLLAVVGTALFVAAFALVVSLSRRTPSSDAEEFSAAWTATRNDLRKILPFSRFRRTHARTA